MGERKRVSTRDAARIHGIATSYELMDNGEFRARMTPIDGNGYIRTVAASVGAWQNAHYHNSLRETYIVESGWIASAEREGDTVRLRIHFPGDVFTTAPRVSHNIYMSANSVIHTVKHGGAGQADWHKDDDLNNRTHNITERELILSRHDYNQGDRFSSYMDLYNNLDKLLWSVPGYLGIGGAVVIGFFGSIISRETAPHISPGIFSGVLVFASLLFYLGYVSITRIREHHTAAGHYLAELENCDGYFAFRRKTVARFWPFSATTCFRITYAVLSIALFTTAILILARPSLIQYALAS